MVIEWKEDLATGNEEIDTQHKELFQQFNNLQTACNQGRGRKELYNMMIFLDDYVTSHFAMEEHLQIKYAYPGYQTHKEEHDSFLNNFKQLVDRFYRKGATPTLVIQTDLTMINWLIRHVNERDKALANFLNTVMQQEKQDETPAVMPNS
jgi:hemerythrin